jgi:hypothetical protein
LRTKSIGLLGRIWKNRLEYHKTFEAYNWVKLLRSNAKDKNGQNKKRAGPRFAVYDDIIYHHDSGSHRNMDALDKKIMNKMKVDFEFYKHLSFRH